MAFSFFKSDSETMLTLPERGSRWLRGRFAVASLALISLAESIFLPVIIDPFLIALIMVHPRRWKLYVVLAVLASTLGGAVAYWLGAKFFDTFGTVMLSWYGLEPVFTKIATQLDASGFVFVLIGAFTPVPYKVVALASGVLHINFLTFMVASLIGRLLRLGLVGGAAYMFGPSALPLVQRNLKYIASVVGVLLILYLVLQFVL